MDNIPNTCFVGDGTKQSGKPFTLDVKGSSLVFGAAKFLESLIPICIYTVQIGLFFAICWTLFEAFHGDNDLISFLA